MTKNERLLQVEFTLYFYAQECWINTELMTSKKQRGRKTNPIIQAILDEYQPKTTEDVHEAIKDIFAPMLEAMPQGEMDHHLGYEANEHGGKNTDNRRNGYSQKNIKTSYGEIPIEVPRDRQSTFEPQLIPKRTKDKGSVYVCPWNESA